MTSKLIKYVFTVVIALAFVPAAMAIPLSPNSTWANQIQYMEEGDTFSSTYTATTDEQVSLTAWGAVSDQFKISVSGLYGDFSLNSSVVPDWNALGMTSAVPDTDFADFNAVFASGLYSTASFWVHKGDIISIQLTHLALDDGSIYSDGDFGAVALESTPEPVTFALAGLALAALGFCRRRRLPSKEQL